MTVLDSLLANLTIFFIKLYQLTLSPDKGIFSPILKGRICSHEPHCSEYAVRTLKRYGFRKGIGKVIERVLHCKPRMMKIYDPEHYRVVFFSSAPLGVPFLEALAKDKRFEVIGVVTQADKPVGRGLQMQENVIKTKGKEIFTTTLVRYFFLKESLQNWREESFARQHLQWTPYEDWGIIVYAHIHQHTKLLKLFQKLLLPWPRYFDTSGAHHLIGFQNAIFDLDNNEHEAAKIFGRTLHIPEEQLSWSPENPTNFYEEIIQTPARLNPEKSLEGKAFYDRLKAKNPDFIVVIAYGKILPQSVLDLAHFGAINVHGSLLPKYRWASPLQSVFLHKEEQSLAPQNCVGWLTIMKMDAWMDTGDIIDTFSFSIPFHRTVVELIKALQQKWPKFLNDTLWNFGKGLLGTEKQNEDEATYTQKIEKADGFFVLSTDTLEDVYAKYRALALRPKARCIWQDKRIIIEKLVLDEELFEIHKHAPLLDNGKLNAAVKEILLKPEGKKAMDWKSFVNGYLK